MAPGMAMFALQEPGQQRVGRGRGGPGSVAGAEEPDGVEGGAGGLERPHDLDGCVAGFGREEGFGSDAFERGEGVGEGDAGAVEVERGEFVEGALPFAAGLEFDAVELRQRRPAGGFEEVVDGGGPVGMGALAGEFARVTSGSQSA